MSESQSLEEERVRKSLLKFMGYVVSCRRNNTEDWMRGLVDHFNDALAKVGEPERVCLHHGGLRIEQPSNAFTEREERRV